ncbi:rod shape-determining protein MreC [Allomuricauda sp. SCSIO 65647]|uniref:rod shape-determining protein MreC n=1 Tax=Allomuricauda sp. SCSIO 65647 TaxID=2908843 RepID=UPI001F275C38|nr:rod shape-determining protein MreC [Muricauda sp. SCSIO 65647]UJH66315.1 rod shape-determining protein MreC [Muricauda sp. SCSIO 65647]
MQQIINFILRYRNSFLYAFLGLVAIALTVRSHSYHQSKFFNSSKWLTANTYRISNNISSYFDLRNENEKLSEENRALRQLLFNQEQSYGEPLDSTQINYKVIRGKVIKNSYTSLRNYVTIDIGKNQGVNQDMGVITSQGILGIVENTSNSHSTVQSILNIKSNINAKVKNTNYFGSLVWDGDYYDAVQLTDIPRLVPLVVGDTIITGGMSSIFPEGIPIGTIKKYELNTAQSFYDIEVSLFNDMANIGYIYVIENFDRPEILELESQTNDAQ